MPIFNTAPTDEPVIPIMPSFNKEREEKPAVPEISSVKEELPKAEPIKPVMTENKEEKAQAAAEQQNADKSAPEDPFDSIFKIFNTK